MIWVVFTNTKVYVTDRLPVDFGGSKIFSHQGIVKTALLSTVIDCIYYNLTEEQVRQEYPEYFI